MNTDISDFNLWHMSDYGRNVFLVAGRIYDLAPDRWERLTCIWYGRHGLQEVKDDRYITETMVRYKTVDALCAESDPQMNDVAKFLYEGWMAKKAHLAATRNTPPVVILPPKPEPEPLPKPKPEPKPEPEPEPKPEPKPTKKKRPLKLWVAVLGALAFGLKFTPVPAAVLLAIDWLIKILQAIPQ